MLKLSIINFPVFLISFAIGMFAVYITLPDSKVIKVYPSPDNYKYIQYKDKANNCFGVKETKVTCPDDSADISKTQIQS